MIALLRGRIAAVEDGWVIIDTGGVGYEVFCHLRTLARLHELEARGSEASLHIHTGVSADAIRLYGFLTAEELRLFRLLLGVERIGPKAALGILGRSELPTLVRALRAGDDKLVATVPGIGPKTAARVILELRGRVENLALPGDTERPDTAEGQAVTLAVEGLRGLGFREGDARTAVTAALADIGGEPDVNAIVAAALRRLDLVSA